MAVEENMSKAWNESATLQIVDAGEFQPDDKTASHLITKYASNHYERARVSTDDYRTLNQQGFLKVEGLLSANDVRELSQHMDDVLAGKEVAAGFPKIDPSWSVSQRVAAFSRIHNAHRVHALHERFLLHPRILDVVEQLSGPDILALQSMAFFKEPGQPGQGYHQDSYYIPTQPNSLIAAWVAISDATEDNGCLWFRAGSQVEPTYPCPGNSFTQAASGLDGVFQNFTASVLEPTDNQLTGVAERYPEIPCPAKPGDVVFFRGNILHRSHANNSTTPRRAFVAHYCDARSFVPWNIGRGWEGMSEGKGANDLHILARGDSHLPYARPRFGTPIQRL